MKTFNVSSFATPEDIVALGDLYDMLQGQEAWYSIVAQTGVTERDELAHERGQPAVEKLTAMILNASSNERLNKEMLAMQFFITNYSLAELLEMRGDVTIKMKPEFEFVEPDLQQIKGRIEGMSFARAKPTGTEAECIAAALGSKPGLFRRHARAPSHPGEAEVVNPAIEQLTASHIPSEEEIVKPTAEQIDAMHRIMGAEWYSKAGAMGSHDLLTYEGGISETSMIPAERMSRISVQGSHLEQPIVTPGTDGPTRKIHDIVEWNFGVSEPGISFARSTPTGEGSENLDVSKISTAWLANQSDAEQHASYTPDSDHLPQQGETPECPKDSTCTDPGCPYHYADPTPTPPVESDAKLFRAITDKLDRNSEVTRRMVPTGLKACEIKMSLYIQGIVERKLPGGTTVKEFCATTASPRTVHWLEEDTLMVGGVTYSNVTVDFRTDMGLMALERRINDYKAMLEKKDPSLRIYFEAELKRRTVSYGGRGLNSQYPVEVAKLAYSLLDGTFRPTDLS